MSDENSEQSSIPAASTPAQKPATTPATKPRTRHNSGVPTIYDVAKLAGVNPSTVSRALSLPGRINIKTEAKVRAAAEQLNYRLNPIARALPTGRTGTIGLIIADMTNPMFFNTMRGAERSASAHEYTLVLAESQESGDREAETIERVLPSVDGLILVTTRLTDAAILELAARKPLVLLNRRVDGVQGVVPAVAPGIDQALEHLAALGHRSLAYLAGPAASWMNTARWEALSTRSAALGLKIKQIGPGSPTFEGGQAALAAVTASGATAVLAYNDLMAIGLMRASTEAGQPVPHRLSIVGFDDIFGAELTSPQLTTVRTPLDQLGERAVGRLLEQLDRRGPGHVTHPERQSVLSTELIVRGSTGAPRT